MKQAEQVSAQNKRQMMILRADRAATANDFTLAYRLYRELLRQCPDDCDILLRLAGMYVRKGEDEQGAAVYQKVLNIMPDTVPALTALGGIYRRQEKYHESLAVLERALAAGGSTTDIYYNLGFTYEKKEQYAEAAACFTAVIEQNPRDVLACNHLGRVYALQGNHKQAAAVYRQALAIDPNHPVIHYNLALSYEAEHNYTAARQEYETALKAKPGWSDALNGYAELLIMQDMLDQAYSTLKKAVDLQPDSSRSHSALGKVYEARGEMDMAEGAYKQALKQNPLYLNALKGLAAVYSHEHRFSEAKGLLDKAEEYYPNDVSVPVTYASVLLDEGNPESARQKIEPMLPHHSDNVNLLDVFGQYCIVTNRDEKARSIYSRIENIDPHYHRYCKQAAHRLIQRGDYHKAEKYLKKYLENHPNDANVLMVLAQNYEHNEQFDEAIRLYQQIADLDTRAALAEKAMHRLSSIPQQQNAAENNLQQTDEIHMAQDIDLPIDETDASFIVEADSVPTAQLAAAEADEPFDLSLYTASKSAAATLAEIDDSIDTLLEADSEPFAAEFRDTDAPLDIDGDLFNNGEAEELPHMLAEEDEHIIEAETPPQKIFAEPEPLHEKEPEPQAEQAREEIPAMSDMLVDDETAHTYKELRELFIYLRSLCDTLPPLERELFLSSTVRMQLDYLIQKVSGRPGLLAVVNNLHRLGFCRGRDMSGDPADADRQTAGISTDGLLAHLRTMISLLPDRHLGAALDRNTAAIQNTLHSIIYR